MHQAIRVRGARQNNLRGVDVDIPHGALTVVTGPSGSGKSSLAFDTVYAEGQRRYVESLSTYAKQFLERMPKPDVESVEGVRPSVAIDQRNQIQSSRSTVATVTELHDHLRLLWSRVGHTICPDCERRVLPDTVRSAADAVLALPAGTRAHIAFPWSPGDRPPGAAVGQLRARGFVRAVADGREVRLDAAEDGAGGAGAGGAGAGAGAAAEDVDAAAGRALADAAEAFVVVDRLVPTADERERLADGLAAAFAEGHGEAAVLVSDSSSAGAPLVPRLRFSERARCGGCGREFPEPAPLLFSFHHPTGACPECNGFGAVLEYALDLVVPDPGRSLAAGALDPWTKPRYRKERAAVLAFARRRGLDSDAPWRDLPEEARHALLHGSEDFQGIFPFLRDRESKRYKQYIRVFLRQYQRPVPCAVCGGTRLRAEAGHVRVAGRTLGEVSALTLDAFREWLDGVSLSPFEERVAAPLLDELRDRTDFLRRVGLGYLTLDRRARSLSGGEMQRIRLAGNLGSRLVDTLYVLDEPTIGLHPRDTDRFIGVLERLRDEGNTVLVVEHEAAVLRAADRIVELGPGAGERGGEVVFTGRWDELLAAGTATGEALRPGSGPRRGDRRPPAAGWLELCGARLHNVRGVDLRLPLGALIAVTGVSGSGKSTLVHDILYRALETRLHGGSTARRHLDEAEGEWEELRGVDGLEEAVLVDQSPIGRSSRSNPVTYVKAWDEVRKVFASRPEAVRRGFKAGHFSFNVDGGRCETCRGAGEEIVEMVFLADVAIPCETCGGARFRPEVLEVRYRGLNVREVLDLTVDEAIRFFIRQERLGQALWQLQRVGLGYLRLGQPATTLSGGEAQRLKIARELDRRTRPGRRRIYLLDEPTTGLGAGEVSRLVGVLRELTAAGHTVVVIEHDLDVVAAADWIVDLGPGAADEGGRIVVAGPPAEVARTAASHTGRFLARHLAAGAPAAEEAGATGPAAGSGSA
ncbi:MAG: excinuclease ABC subunit UvrA [Gemmatimonadota bacterium]|nr:excinuclease ABC subunit UvrA [Gemmatimonadota bacterium]